MRKLQTSYIIWNNTSSKFNQLVCNRLCTPWMIQTRHLMLQYLPHCTTTCCVQNLLSLKKAKVIINFTDMIKFTKRQDVLKLTSSRMPLVLVVKWHKSLSFDTHQLLHSPHEAPPHTWRDTTSVSLPQQPWLPQEHPCRDIDLLTHSIQNWSPVDKTSSTLQQVYSKPSHPSGWSDQSGNLTVHKGLIKLKTKFHLVISVTHGFFMGEKGQETRNKRIKKSMEGRRGKKIK